MSGLGSWLLFLLMLLLLHHQSEQCGNASLVECCCKG